MADKARKKKKTGSVVTVDFKDVETRELVPEDDYIVKVKDITEEEGGKGPYLNWVLTVNEGEYKGKVLYYVTSLTKQSLWNLRAVLEALGIEVPKSKMSLELSTYKGLTMGVSVEIEKFKGKEKNVVVDVWNPDEEDDENEDEPEEEDEGGSDEDENEEDEPEEITEEDENSDDEDEEYTGTIKEIDDDVLTVEIDDEEVDVYTEDAEITGKPAVGAQVTIKGSYDEDEDLIATEVEVKAKKKTKTKEKDSKKKK